MNKRIKTLAEQAKLTTELWHNPEPFVIYKEDVNYPGGLEKFAELIVKECAYIGFTAAYPEKSDEVSMAIKEHFGANV